MIPTDDSFDGEGKPGMINAKQYNYLNFRFIQFLSTMKSTQATELIQLIKEKDYEEYVFWKKTLRKRHSDDSNFEDLK